MDVLLYFLFLVASGEATSRLVVVWLLADVVVLNNRSLAAADAYDE
jgi:hypothetical protein